MAANSLSSSSWGGEPSPSRDGFLMSLDARLENTTTRRLQLWLCITKGITAKNFDVYSWPRGRTYNGICQPEDATGVFAQTLRWQLTGCWPWRGKYPLVITPWADKHIASHLQLVCSSPRVRGVGPEGWCPTCSTVLSPSPAPGGERRLQSPPGAVWAA